MGGPRVHGSRGRGETDVWSAFGAGLAGAPGDPGGQHARRRDVDRRRPSRQRPGIDRRWAALDRRARELEPSPNGMVARPVVAPLAVVGEHPRSRGLGPSRRPVRGRGRPRPHRQGRPGPPRRPPVADRARRPQRVAPPRRERSRRARSTRSVDDGRARSSAPPRSASPARRAGRSGRLRSGSIRRGADAAEDEALATELLASEKDRRSRRSSSTRSGTSWRRSPRRWSSRPSRR